MYQPLIEALDTAKTLFITAHVGPDGDTLGSMLALKFALEKARPNLYRIDCVISGKMPDVYAFLPGLQEVLRMETAKTLLPQYDVALCVDCGSVDRLGLAQPLFRSATTSVNIDHHISNAHFAMINVVEPKAAASAEVIFDLLHVMKIPLDANIATALYTGLVTDTGGFKYSNTTAKVMQTAAALISAGANPEYIFKQLYEEQPLSQVRLQAAAVSAAQLNAAKTVAWTAVPQAMLQQYAALDEQTDGLVENLRRIDSVLIAAVFKEAEGGETRVSLRSDSHAIDVAAIMGVFQGGGHKMAAGCTIHAPLSEAIDKVLPLLEQAVQRVG